MFHRTIFIALSFLAITNAKTITVNPGDSIQKAIDGAQPGDTVHLSDGVHNEDMVTVRDGEKGNPITIKGSRKAIVHGGGNSRVFQVFHDYITIDGFTLDGHFTGDGNKEEHYRDKMLYVHGQRKPRTIREDGKEYRSSIDGVVVKNMEFMRCGGECARFRYFITNAKIYGNRFYRCGVHDFASWSKSKTVNGECVYLGCSSNQTGDGKNPTSETDVSQFILVENNVFESLGNECVDVKEGSKNIVVQNNICSDQLDPNSAGLDSRTDEVIFRYNTVFRNLGAGVRIGGHTVDGHTFGVKNNVYGNKFFDNDAGTIKVQTGTDHQFCDNECKGSCTIGGKTSSGFNDLEGKCSKLIDTSWVSTPIPEKKSEDSSSIEEEEVSKDDSSDDSSDETPKVVVDVELDGLKASDGHDGSMDSYEVCNPVSIKSIDASGHDGNIAANAVDGKSLTRWSSKGKGEWVKVNFASPTVVSSVYISFYNGDKRSQFFDLYADGEAVLTKQKSSGKTLGVEEFKFKKPVTVSEITFMAGGNSDNDWNSITDMIVCSSKKQKEHDVQESSDGCDSIDELEISSIKSSDDDGNKVENLLDADLKTMWSSDSSGASFTLTLKEPSFVSEFAFSVYSGDSRTQIFDVAVNTPRGWIDVIIDGESNNGKGVESYDIGVEDVDQIKFVGYGFEDADGKLDKWNSITSVSVFGCTT